MENIELVALSILIGVMVIVGVCLWWLYRLPTSITHVTRTTAPLFIYVDEQGNDWNDGLSIRRPVRTMQRAMDLVPTMIGHPVSIEIIHYGKR